MAANDDISRRSSDPVIVHMAALPLQQSGVSASKIHSLRS